MVLLSLLAVAAADHEVHLHLLNLSVFSADHEVLSADHDRRLLPFSQQSF